jgi:hypothetical protein
MLPEMEEAGSPAADEQDGLLTRETVKEHPTLLTIPQELRDQIYDEVLGISRVRTTERVCTLISLPR